MADDTPSAELGKLIETYRPIDRRGCRNSLIGLVVIYLIAFIPLLFIVIIASTDPRILPEKKPNIETIFLFSVFGAGLLVIIFQLYLSIWWIAPFLKAIHRRFKVEVYENGVAIYNNGEISAYRWRDINNISIQSPGDYRYGYIWIQRRDRVQMRVSSIEVMRFHQCGTLMMNRWKAFHGAPLVDEIPQFPPIRWLRRKLKR